MQNTNSACEQCGTRVARQYQHFTPIAAGLASETAVRWFCVACARHVRQQLAHAASPGVGVTRDELIARLNEFFAASGVLDICARCHQQGTGCCPPSCRLIQLANGQQEKRQAQAQASTGCQSGKTLFCTTFLCSALLNAISECDPTIGRTLKWLKNEIGVAEWRVYEMFTRVPASERDPVRPLTLPAAYPALPPLDGAGLRPQLSELIEEILEIRRRWQAQEQFQQQFQQAIGDGQAG